ncbi:MAG: sodium:glutamate symporter [Bacteroidales bacterium]|nr:sodium:glutamate symporter [Bacteroidales bacterium]MBP5518237.1 sodium:glutamate symporter [Bacteroidales bacterium]
MNSFFHFEGFTPWVFLVDLGLLSGLLLIGKLIRVKVKVVQQLFIPPSLLAGLLGLALGPNGLGWLPFSGNLSSYAAVLIALVFATLPFSSQKTSVKEVVTRVGPMWVYAQLGMLLQWGVMGLLGIYLFKSVWPDLNQAFGAMLPTGFYGGHGTAAAIGSAFDNLGGGLKWEDAMTLGMTTATVGVIMAIIFGLVIIKWGARKKQTAFIADFKDLPPELRSGLIPKDKRVPLGQETTSSISIEHLTFHIAIVVLVAFLGYLLSVAVKNWCSGLEAPYNGLELPVFSCAFVAGLLLKKLFDVTKVSDYVNRETVQREGSFFTDLLVTCGVASIKIGVVVQYWLPLLVLVIIGVFVVFGITFYFGRRLSPSFWFERSIFAWGWWTGTMAMGIALERIVDPQMKSKTMDDYALAYLPIAPVEIILITLIPISFSAGWGGLLMWICLGASLLLLLLARSMKWWHPVRK